MSEAEKREEPVRPTYEEIYDCLIRYHIHKKKLAEQDVSALRLQKILEECYSEDVDKQTDLFCALTKGVMDWKRKTGKDVIPLSVIIRAFKEWDVEEALICDRLEEIFGSFVVKGG